MIIPHHLNTGINIDNKFLHAINLTKNETIITEYRINSVKNYAAVSVIEYPKLPSRSDLVKVICFYLLIIITIKL